MDVSWDEIQYLVGTACGDEDPLPKMLLKVPGLHSVLLLQLLQVLAAQEERLRGVQHIVITVKHDVWSNVLTLLT